jgi:hypothetical protein
MLDINVLQKLNATNGQASAKILHAHIKEQLDAAKQVVLYFQPGKDQEISGWSESGLAGSEQELNTLAELAQQERYKNIAIIVITSLAVSEAKEASVIAARQACLEQNDISFFDDHEKVAYSRLSAERQTVTGCSAYVFQAWVLNKDSKVIAMLPRQANYLQRAVQVAEYAANPVVPMSLHGNLLAPLILYSQDAQKNSQRNRAEALLNGINHLLQRCQHIIFLFAHANHYRAQAEAIAEADQEARENQLAFIMISTEIPDKKLNFFQDNASNGLFQQLWQWHGPLSCNTYECLTKAWVMNRSGELVATINYQQHIAAQDFIENVLTQVPAENADMGVEHLSKKHKIG